MPTYEYQCLDCGAVFDRTEPMSEHEHAQPQCPQCKSERVEQRFSAFFAKTGRKT